MQQFRMKGVSLDSPTLESALVSGNMFFPTCTDIKLRFFDTLTSQSHNLAASAKRGSKTTFGSTVFTT